MLLPVETAVIEQGREVCSQTPGQSRCPPTPPERMKNADYTLGHFAALLDSPTVCTVRFPSMILSWLGFLYVKSICSRLIKYCIDFLFSRVLLNGLYS